MIAAILFWAVGSVGGYAYIFRYSSSPAVLDEPAKLWPTKTGLERHAGSFDLVIAIHPQCPCTRASVAELNKLMQRWGGKVHAQALVYKPFQFSDLWADSDVTQRLAEVPNTTVHRDLDGSQAAGFGLSVSGQVLLYDPQGKLCFDGGLTAFRGHEGDSVGQEELLALVAGRAHGTQVSKVFGCSLKDKVCAHKSEQPAPPRQGV
jgi:hypothetical protein